MHRVTVEWDELVGDLYSAAIAPDVAARLPEGIARLVGGASAVLWTLDTRQGGIVDRMLTNVPREAMTLYAAHYHAHDPWVAHVRHMPPNTAIRGSSLVDDATLARSVYYNELGKQVGTFHIAGAMLPLGQAAGQTLGMLAVHRARNRSEFADDELRRLAQLLPHVRRALQLRSQVTEAAAAVESAAVGAVLEAFGTAAAVLDGHGRVQLVNTQAEKMDSAGVGLSLRQTSNRMFAVPLPTETRQLHATVADAARGGTGGVLLLHLGAGAVLAMVSPLPPSLCDRMGQPRGRVLLLLRPLYEENGRVLQRRGMMLFGLTRAEVEVAVALCGGMSPQEIADARQVRISTVRTLLQRAQDKLGAGNLRDLVRLLALMQG